VNFRSFSTLQIALGVSVAVHAVLLTVRFVDPEGFNRIFQDTPLEVILVNAKTAEKPDPPRRRRLPSTRWPAAATRRRGAPPRPCRPRR
jgi:protein TonB